MDPIGSTAPLELYDMRKASVRNMDVRDGYRTVEIVVVRCDNTQTNALYHHYNTRTPSVQLLFPADNVRRSLKPCLSPDRALELYCCCIPDIDLCICPPLFMMAFAAALVWRSQIFASSSWCYSIMNLSIRCVTTLYHRIPSVADSKKRRKSSVEPLMAWNAWKSFDRCFLRFLLELACLPPPPP